MSAKLIQAIEVVELRGSGMTVDDPIHSVVRYYSTDGQFLAERDEFTAAHQMMPVQKSGETGSRE